MCDLGYYVNGIDSSGHIVCQPVTPPPACAPGSTFVFQVTSESNGAILPLEQWPGGSQKITLGQGCSVTVQKPSGTIDLIGGTSGTSGWKIISWTGTDKTPVGSILDPACNSTLALVVSTTDDYPTCSSAAVPLPLVGGSPSIDTYIVTIPVE
jgi:hypothetical protein